MTRERLRKEVAAKAELAAEERVLDALVGTQRQPGDPRRSSARCCARAQLDDREIEIEVQDSGAAGLPTFDIPGMPGAQMGMLNLERDVRQGVRRPHQAASSMTVAAELRRADGRGERQAARPGAASSREAIQAVEQNGIVFLDEIDKISARDERVAAPTSAARACSATCCR